MVTNRPKRLAQNCSGIEAELTIRIPGVRSKRDLIGLIERLCLEYWTDDSITPFYEDIMVGGGFVSKWEFVAPTDEFAGLLKMKEAFDIHEALVALRPELKSLRGVAVGAFLRARNVDWPKMNSKDKFDFTFD